MMDLSVMKRFPLPAALATPFEPKRPTGMIPRVKIAMQRSRARAVPARRNCQTSLPFA